MHANGSQVVGTRNGQIARRSDPFLDDRTSGGYYFLLPKRDKPRRKAAGTQAPITFGPYRSPHEASFIWTSAHALGLI